MVRAPDLKSAGRGFKSRSDRFADVVLGSPEFNLVNNQLVCLPPVGILNLVMFVSIFNYHFLFYRS